MRSTVLALCFLSILTGQSLPTAEQTRAVLKRLGEEADRFERNAHRFTGIETLRQLQPEGTRYGKGPRGIETKLPEVTHEIVSEYGYISADEPGGSLKEVRLIQTVNGLKWKRGKKGLNELANQIGTRDAKDRKRSLESFEDYGLRGFLSDAGQVILLFARQGADKYEFVFDRLESAVDNGPAWIYRFQQLDGKQAFTIYGEKEPLRQRLQGEVWVRAQDALPMRVALKSEHMLEESPIRDITLVDYRMTSWGLLLPSRIDHRQFVDQQLFVVDEFAYANFKQTLPGNIR